MAARARSWRFTPRNSTRLPRRQTRSVMLRVGRSPVSEIVAGTEGVVDTVGFFAGRDGRRRVVRVGGEARGPPQLVGHVRLQRPTLPTAVGETQPRCPALVLRRAVGG